MMSPDGGTVAARSIGWALPDSVQPGVRSVIVTDPDSGTYSTMFRSGSWFALNCQVTCAVALRPGLAAVELPVQVQGRVVEQSSIVMLAT